MIPPDGGTGMWGRPYRTDVGQPGGAGEGMAHQHQGGARSAVSASLVGNNLPPTAPVKNVFK